MTNLKNLKEEIQKAALREEAVALKALTSKEFREKFSKAREAAIENHLIDSLVSEIVDRSLGELKKQENPELKSFIDEQVEKTKKVILESLA